MNGGYRRSDAFTRLNLPICPNDDAVRPIDPDMICWLVVAPQLVGWDYHPSISFPIWPVMRVRVHNRGTIDATGAFLETALHHGMLGGEPWTGFEPLRNVPVPTVPAGGSVDVDVEFSSATEFGAFGSFHARAFDTYSLLHHPQRCFDWRPVVNPQATFLPFTLFLFCASDPLVLPLHASNETKEDLPVRVLVTKAIRTADSDDVSSLYPLPFRHEWFRRGRSGIPPRARPRSRCGRVIPEPAANGLWPDEQVASRHVHNRFGFMQDTRGLSAAKRKAGGRPFYLPKRIEPSRLRSFIELKALPGKKLDFFLVIPPEEQPQPGEECVFQVDYQVGQERPTRYAAVIRGASEESAKDGRPRIEQGRPHGGGIWPAHLDEQP